MKKLLFLLALPLAAQTSINVGTITVPNDVSASVETFRLKQFSTPNPVPTLTSSINGSVTTITVSTTVGIVAGNQVVIDTEAMNVSSVPDSTHLVITRGASITSPASHLQGAAINLCTYNNAIALIKMIIKTGVQQILNQVPSSSMSTLSGNLNTAQTSITTYLDTVVQ